MTEEKLNTALEIKGKQSVAEQQIAHIRQLLEKVESNEQPTRMQFHFHSDSHFARPILKGLIEVFENQHSLLDLEFSKL